MWRVSLNRFMSLIKEGEREGGREGEREGEREGGRKELSLEYQVFSLLKE